MLKREITNLKKAYEPLLDGENNLNSPIGIFQSSPEGKLYQVNKKLAGILGYESTEELIYTVNKTDLRECIYVNKENASKFEEEAIKDGLWHSHECKFYRKDGDIVVVELSFRAVKNSDSSVKYLEGFIKDITEYKNTEKELKTIKQNYMVLFNSSPNYVMIVGLDGVLLDINKAACEIAGLPPEKLIGKSVIELTFLFGEKFDEEMPVFKETLSQILKGNEAKIPESTFIDKNGIIRHIESFFTPISLDNEIVAFCVICHDITERKNAENLLKESENRYRKLLENSFDAVIVHDGNKVISANNVAMKILGIKNPEELSGKPLHDLIHPEYYETARRRIQILKVEGKLTPLEEKALQADGTPVDVEVLAVEFIYEGKRAFQTVFRDITEYKIVEEQKNSLIKELKEFTKYLESTNKKLEYTTQELQQKEEKLNFINKTLREREEQLKLFIEYAPAAIAMFDNNMNYISTSKRWITDYHLEEQEIIGRSHYEVSPNITNELREVHKRCLAGASERAEEYKLVLADGSIQWVKWEVIPWYSISGNIGGIIIFSEDITENKIAENKIRKSLEEKEVLLREIHHRVKNNLQIISSLLTLQTNYVENSEAINVLYESQNRIKSMAMIHEMLYQSDDLATINFSDYIGDLVQYLFYSYNAEGNIILTTDAGHIFLNIETAIPCGLIISELVSNSLKYAFPNNMSGKILIKLNSHDDEFELIISDNGIGLPENIDFRNVNASLGLRLVNVLVNQLDGSIKLDKTEGTKFIIRFRELEYKKRL